MTGEPSKLSYSVKKNRKFFDNSEGIVKKEIKQVVIAIGKRKV